MKVASVNYKCASAEKVFTNSLKHTGFGILENHPVNWELIESVYKEWRSFMTSETVNNYYYNKNTQDGYFPPDVSEVAKGEKHKDLKHYFHLYFPWGQYPHELSDNAKKLFEQLYQLGQELLKWIDNNLDINIAKKLKESFSDSISYERTLLRILHYPALKGSEEKGAIRAAAHEDINLITLLPVASSPGLEIYSKYDNSWHEVSCKPKSIIVNIGDMMQEMTEHQYIATKHRVVNPKAEKKSSDRMSIPCFIHAKANTYLSKKYPTAADFLNERLIELGVK